MDEPAARRFAARNTDALPASVDRFVAFAPGVARLDQEGHPIRQAREFDEARDEARADAMSAAVA
jgi:hypothetical protein